MGVGIEFARKNSKEREREREREEEGQRRLQQKLQMEEGRSLTRLSGPFRIAFGRDTRDESEKDAPREKELRTGDETLKSLWDYGRNEISYKSVFHACFSGRCGLNFVEFEVSDVGNRRKKDCERGGIEGRSSRRTRRTVRRRSDNLNLNFLAPREGERDKSKRRSASAVTNERSIAPIYLILRRCGQEPPRSTKCANPEFGPQKSESETAVLIASSSRSPQSPKWARRGFLTSIRGAIVASQVLFDCLH